MHHPSHPHAVNLTLAAALACFAASSPASAHTATVAVASNFTTMDPYDAGDVLSRSAAKSFYEGLFAFDKDLKPQPQLAESYAVSEDGKIYDIKLRQGVMFHDGTEFGAEAVKINFDRVLDKKNGLTRHTFFNFIDRVEVTGKYEVRFVLKNPMSGFISRLSNGTGQMICPSAIKKYGNDGLAFNACGTGPYKLKYFNPSERLEVVKNPNYRVPGLPKLDGITWIPVPENNTRANMLMTGEADYIHQLPPELYNRMASRDDLTLFNAPSIMQRFLTINMLQKPFDDVRVRQAIAYAINKEAFCKVVYNGFARPATGVLPAEVPGAVNFGGYPYDPQKARELLKEAGYPSGFKTELWGGFNSSTIAKAVQFIAQQLRQVGIDAATKQIEAGQKVELIDSNPDPATAPVRLYYISWSNSTAEPDWGIRPFFDSRCSPPNLLNTSYYRNPAVDAALDKGLAAVKEEDRIASYEEAQQLIWKDVPTVPLITENGLAGVNKKLKNFYPTPDSSFSFYEASWEE